MSKAAATLTHDHTRSHYRSLNHVAAMQEAGNLGLNVTVIALTATGTPELTKFQWLALSRLADRLEDLLAVREFEE